MRRSGAAVAAGLALALGVVQPALAGGIVIVERVHATPKRHPASGCAFVVLAPLVGGGTQRTCIVRFDGVPGPRAVTHSTGTMTFRLARGSIRAHVRITQRFGKDGVHARQTVRGTIVGGTRAFHRARGTLSGSGTVTDRKSGLGPCDLLYSLRISSVGS